MQTGAYHSELAKCLPEDFIQLEDVLKDYEKYKICGLVFAVQHLPIALLNEELARKYVENLDEYSFVSRKDFILEALERDEYYRCRIEESVEELIQVMMEK